MQARFAAWAEQLGVVRGFVGQNHHPLYWRVRLDVLSFGQSANRLEAAMLGDRRGADAKQRVPPPSVDRVDYQRRSSPRPQS